MSDPASASTRLFLAVPLPKNVVEGVQAIRRRLQSQLQANPATARIPVRWVPASQYHVTLVFHPQFPDTEIPNLKSELLTITTNQSSFSLSFEGPQLIPGNRRPPRILWLGATTGSEELSSLRRQALSRVPALNLPSGDQAPNREFRPHLTVARLKAPPSPTTACHLRAITSSVATTAPPPSPLACTVPHLLLIKSILTPSGPQYTTLKSLPLPPATSTP